MRSISASGTRRSPIFLLSLSTNTGRDGSSRRSASHRRVSKAFCDGCALPGTRPSTEPRWLARRFEVEHLRACGGERMRAGGSCPSRSARRSRASRTAAGSASSSATTARRNVAVAAFEHVDAKADLVEHGRERAAALAAAPAVDERRPFARLVEHVALDVRRDVARDERRAALLRLERRDLLVLACRSRARSPSSSDGQLTAPGSRSSANSPGERASTMVSKRPRSAIASAALTRIRAMDHRRWERRSDAAAGRAPGRPKPGRAPSGGSERTRERGG